MLTKLRFDGNLKYTNTIFDHFFVEQREPRSGFGRNKTRVVTFRVPHNAAVQIYDYKEKTARYNCNNK